MKYAWDENKRLDNIHKHGIDFVGCDAIFDGYTVTAEDLRFDYDEQRFKTLGVLMAVWSRSFILKLMQRSE